MSRSRPSSSLKNLSFILMILSSVIIFVVGVITLMWGIADSRDAVLSVNWPSAPGSITSSDVKISSSVKGGATYSAKISYTYSVHDKPYTGSQVNLGTRLLLSLADVRQIVARYPVGKSVNVFYNPNDTSKAVLEPGFVTSLWFPMGVGAVLTFVGCGMLIRFAAAYRRNNPPESENFA